MNPKFAKRKKYNNNNYLFRSNNCLDVLQMHKTIIIIRLKTYNKLTGLGGEGGIKSKTKLKKINNLQVQNNSLFTSKNSGGIGKQGIENAEITRVDLDTVHDSVLVYIQNGAVSGGVEQYPAPR